MIPEPAYFMETDGEGQRIYDKTDRKATRSQFEMAGLKPGMFSLDIGCASGAATQELAEMCFPAHAIGLDSSQLILSEAKENASTKQFTNLRFVHGNVYSLPFEDNSFDFVWTRFLFEYLKEPVTAIREMKRVTKPGGLVVCADLDGNCLFHYPMEDQLRRGLQHVIEKLEEKGFDPWVGRKLFSYFRHVGFSEISANMIPHHLIAGKPSPRERNNWFAKIDTIGEKFKTELGDERNILGLIEGFKAFIDNPDTFTYSPLIVMTGVK